MNALVVMLQSTGVVSGDDIRSIKDGEDRKVDYALR